MVEQTDDRAAAEAMAAIGVDQTQSMVCPVCGFENLQGDDLCANCGADLASSDIPHASTPFERLLVDVPLDSLKTRPPFTVEAGTSVAEVVRRMRDEATADILVVDDGRLVGIFTERDAALKLAGPAGAGIDLATTPIRDVMTHDPVVLRAADSVAVAVQKMAVGGIPAHPTRAGRPAGGRHLRRRRVPPHPPDHRVTVPGAQPGFNTISQTSSRSPTPPMRARISGRRLSSRRMSSASSIGAAPLAPATASRRP